jgi:hypothetical protein
LVLILSNKSVFKQHLIHQPLLLSIPFVHKLHNLKGE